MGCESIASNMSPTFTDARCAADPGFMSLITNAPCDDPTCVKIILKLFVKKKHFHYHSP